MLDGDPAVAVDELKKKHLIAVWSDFRQQLTSGESISRHVCVQMVDIFEHLL